MCQFRLPSIIIRAQGTRGSIASLAVIVLFSALVLRLAAARGELWLDEIWSLESASHVQSPWEILAGLRHDNNHIVNTAWLWLLGPDQAWITYRLASVVAGTLTVAAAGMVAARAGRTASITAMTLFGASYWMIHYSSEVRGYAWALFFVLAGVESLLQYASRPRWRWAIGFWTCCGMGLLAHPIYLHFWLASAYWSLLLAGRNWGWTVAWKPLALCHGVPLFLAAALWKFRWSQLELGGGPAYSLESILLEVSSVTIGGPAHGWGACVAAAVTVAAVVFVAQRWRRKQLGTLVAMACALPILQAVAARPPFLFARYFLVAALFATLAVAVALSWVYRQGKRGRIAYALLVAAFLIANTWHTETLVRVGRGQCVAALSYMAAESDYDENKNESETEIENKNQVTISSDHDFGISTLVAFHRDLAKPQRRFRYIRGREWSREVPQWLVLHRETAFAHPPPQAALMIDGHTYQLARVYDCAPYSGWRWVCYRRLSPGTAGFNGAAAGLSSSE